MWKRIVVAFAILTALPCWAETGQSPVILTVTGNVATPNRGASDAFDDVVFAHLDVTFDTGFALTLADLQALPQRSEKAQYNGWPREITATGPSLIDVLQAASATGKTITVQAIDGYAVDLTAKDLAADKLILALTADGKALALGGRGPIWLFGAPGAIADMQDDAGLVYGVIRLDVR